MLLNAGQALSFYEILGPLGAGGMGEVYRARDTRLDREVAIKVLPAVFVEDEERLRRFEREAKTLAALNHPNIAQIYGIDQEGDTCFLTLELVPGEDLGERIARGPLPIDEAIDACRQIAEALAAAHDSGVIHRDLKPANVRLAPDGTVKVLDFGLAKPVGPPRSGSGPSTPPRPDSFLVTEDGLVLGTPTYMSPEQARGRPVDRRTDVWSFGCVLYECLTGERAFDGAAVAEVLAAILEHDPDFSRLPRETPPRVVELVRRTLVRDPHGRLQHLGDARLELELARDEPVSSPVTSTPPAERRSGARAAALLAGGGLLVGALATWTGLRANAPTPNASPPRTHVSVPISSTSSGIHPRLAPDGRSIVFASTEPDEHGGSRNVLMLRRLETPEPVRLPGTEHPNTLSFSPDGASLAVVVAAAAKSTDLRAVRVILDEATPRAVPVGPWGPEPNLSSAIAWTDDDLLVGTSNRRSLIVVPVDGGAPREVPLKGLSGMNAGIPDVYRALPGGRFVLGHTFEYKHNAFEPALFAIDVESGDTRRLLSGGHAKRVPNGPLLFTRADTLFAVELDIDALEVEGTPRPVIDGLRTTESWRPAWFDVSRDGTLLFEPGGLQGHRREIVFVEQDGALERWSTERYPFDGGGLRVAADGGLFVQSIVASSGLIELWGSEVDPPLLRPLVANPAADIMPAGVGMDPDYLYYTLRSQEEPESIWRAPLGAPDRAELLWSAPSLDESVTALGLTPDGERLFLRLSGDSFHLAELAVRGDGPHEPRELFPIDSYSWSVDESPSGRWLALTMPVNRVRTAVIRRHNEDGSHGSMIPVPLGAETVQWVMWSKSAPEAHETLLAITEDDRILELDVHGDDPPRFSAPRLRASIPGQRVMDGATLPDGRLLLTLRGLTERQYERVELVLGALSSLPDE